MEFGFNKLKNNEKMSFVTGNGEVQSDVPIVTPSLLTM